MAGFGATHTTAHPAQTVAPRGSHIGATAKGVATVPASRMALTHGIVPMSSAQIGVFRQHQPSWEQVYGLRGRYQAQVINHVVTGTRRI